jgi:hypothetical protein
MTRIGIVALLLMVGGCQLASVSENVDSPYYPPPVGSRLILKKDLTIPVGSARVALQGGKEMKPSAVNQYHPHCLLEVNAALAATQTVKADEFLVTHVTTNWHQVKARHGFVKVGLNLAGTFSWNNYLTVMTLSSAKQPNVRSLTCQQWDNPSGGTQVSIQQMRAALGEFFSLELPPGSSGEKPQK